MYDLVIIGGGPAAVAAGVYAARKKLNTLLITELFGGQSITSNSIENWIGAKAISGLDLAQNLEGHLRAQQSIEIKTPERVRAVREIPCVDGRRPCDYEIETDSGAHYQAKAVVVASGSRRKRLGVPGEDAFEGKGVAFCSTCDAPIFGGKRVAVIGGGNSALEAVIDLLPYATHIYLLHRGTSLKGDQVTQDEIKKHENVEVLFNVETQEILGDKFVTGLRYKDSQSGEARELSVDGVFVEIGAVPNSEIVKELVTVNQFGEVVLNHRTGETSRPGVFAAGDVTDELYKQNNISAGDAVKAALSAYGYLMGLKHRSAAAEDTNSKNSK